MDVSTLHSTNRNATSGSSPRVPEESLKAAQLARLGHLRNIIEEATHLLPAQGPITAFVHHNTLHAFEHLPFDEAVVLGGKLFNCHPYLPEQRYRKKLEQGRILPEDIEAVLRDDLGDRGDEFLGFLGTRFSLNLNMLAYPLQSGPIAELRWVVAETDALSKFRKETMPAFKDHLIESTRRWVMRDLRNGHPPTHEEVRARELVDKIFEYFDKPDIEHWDLSTWEAFTLHLLWFVCRDGVACTPSPEATHPLASRHRDVLLEATGGDSDRLVHEVLIRFCAAFMDQGFGSWPLPQANGFFASFSALYQSPYGPPDHWMRRLRAELKRIQQEGITPLESIAQSLEMLGVGQHEEADFLQQSILALKGFAGMLWQLECRGDRVARPVPPQTLIEFLAVRLILDRLAIAYLADDKIGYRGDLRGVRTALANHIQTNNVPNIDQRAFTIFQLAQLLGWTPEVLYKLHEGNWLKVLREVENFSSIHRRRIYQRAFERRYRLQALDAMLVHTRRLAVRAKKPFFIDSATPAFQFVTCIDDREESFRRHLEEVAPECETLGAAGFFAVAMYYRGAADAYFTPLCPVIIKPSHYVVEQVVYSQQQKEHLHRNRRRTIGTVTQRVHLGSRTFAGGWFAALFGSFASLPLVMRILFPRATARLRNAIGGFVKAPSATELQLERTEDSPGQTNGHIGYSIEEMTGIVTRILEDIGLTSNFSRLVMFCGHGSSSLNNPHESAYNCGACAGARGGPNARTISRMANDPRVRVLLEDRGLKIPAETVFVGCYHDTCDDSVAFYDLDRLPLSHRELFGKTQEILVEARRRNAHERCRRFRAVSLKESPEAALKHVESRSEDLSQARPEYNHATNSLCIVGRREWNRGLFLDRRAFLTSYDPSQDDEDRSILTRILQAAMPVCAGISLEYFFSTVDSEGYGCGNKLPHNITSLLGVMTGAASDLRPGLSAQMVEIHEPLRILFVIETTPEAMLNIMEKNEEIARLVRGEWVQLATIDPKTSQVHCYVQGEFESYSPETDELPEVASSGDWYRGWRDHLGFASITPSQK
ncbi:DUF2309 domain-containing protein [Bythopirellula goksoeyrii]|uniref:Probable inorganic carbon transporter subunit DabA n=1 Tax=Bythopirellula goksoeyrii TaxID=1400387 RepID=A0A5B9QG69_9BACT|nr:DUF2309 domain-containing protein [Bythopirellula goksoeyrii]QEG36899.1 hypothetical protein Pr1d_42380 [Bythopirellula goksoeyrii]